MQTNKITMTFKDPDIEREFIRVYDQHHVIFNRIGLILSMIVWVGINLFVFYLLPRHFTIVFMITALVVLPVLSIVLLLTFFSRYIRFFQGASAFANTVTALAALYITFNYFMEPAFISGAMILMPIYAFFIFRLRLSIAVPITMFYSIIYQVSLIYSHLSDFHIFILSIFIWGPLFAFVLAGYNFEKMTRELFISTHTLSLRNRDIERDLSTARLIVENLLPESTDILPFAQCHVTYLPMDKVGGDFYDIQNDNDRLRLFIADVSGHGLASSYHALITKLSMNRIKRDSSPGRTLEKLNNYLCTSMVANNFVTAFLCDIDKETMTLSYSSAGHNPVLLYRGIDGSIVELTSGGKALGWFKDIALDEKSTALASGDRLVMYTDGIIEIFNEDNDLFGEGRLKDFIATHRDLSPKKLSEQLIKSLKTFSESNEFEDDITFITVDIN